jgi:hypothetical protein
LSFRRSRSTALPRLARRGVASSGLRAPRPCAHHQPRASAALTATRPDAIAWLMQSLGRLRQPRPLAQRHIVGRTTSRRSSDSESRVLARYRYISRYRGHPATRRHGGPARGSPVVGLARQRRGPGRPIAQRASDIPGARADARGAPEGLPPAVRGGARGETLATLRDAT